MDRVYDSDAFYARYVLPYYRSLMSWNSTRADDHLLATVKKLAGELSSGEITDLLRAPWRPRVMGAWFALASPRSELSEPVHMSLRTSLGHLTSPPLLVATLAYPDQGGLQAILAYHARDQAAGWGAAGLAVAAAEALYQKLDTKGPLGPAQPEDNRALRQLETVAARLKCGVRGDVEAEWANPDGGADGEIGIGHSDGYSDSCGRRYPWASSEPSASLGARTESPIPKARLLVRHKLGRREGSEPYRIPRSEAARLGQEAAAAIKLGHYLGPHGETVEWAGAVEAAVAAKVSIPPARSLMTGAAGVRSTVVEISDESTLDALARLTADGKFPLGLNYANGVHPGGGFLSGARAQEEALCRASALHATLVGDRMYETHAKRPSPDSSDWAILSPRVPVFRDREDHTLSAPWLADFLTCAAPYAPTVGARRSAELLTARVARVLQIAQAYGYRDLVLGAWGCGAFQNDVHQLVKDFRDNLVGPFAGAFEQVVFAVPGTASTSENLRAFLTEFSEGEMGLAVGSVSG